MKNGFTLIELSIVIVIVGLLTGGVLTAQSLVEAAKVNKLVQTLRNYEISITTFKSKFNYIPGDSKLFNYPGNQNGALGSGASCSAGTGGFWSGDRYNFWAHLSQSGIISENFPAPRCLAPTQSLLSPTLEGYGLQGDSTSIYVSKDQPQSNLTFGFSIKGTIAMAVLNKIGGVGSYGVGFEIPYGCQGLNNSSGGSLGNYPCTDKNRAYSVYNLGP